MAERHFTYADIEAYFNERSEALNAGNDLKIERRLESISLLPELSPPTWLIRYTATYHKGEHNEWTDHHALIAVTEKRDYKGDPWLNGPMLEELPRGFATPAEEDAEIRRLRRERIKAWQAEQAERATPTGDTLIEKDDGTRYLRSTDDITFEL